MSTQLQLAHAGENAPVRAQTGLIERRLSKFRAEVQPRVRSLAAQHRWIADLAGSFPALLFALAVPRKAADAEAALRLVVNGAPLATIAAHARVPLWLRAFPPQAFATALPELPDSPDFRRRIANHAPKTWRVAPRWLDGIALGWHVGDEEIALWFAREGLPQPKRRRFVRKPPQDYRRLVALWAWFSKHERHRAFTSIRTPWVSEMQWKTALAKAHAWSDALELSLFLGDGSLCDAWRDEKTVYGYEFVPLRSALDVDFEAAEMRHCVRSYGACIASNSIRLWSIRKDGQRVATMSLASSSGPLPSIREISSHANKPPPDEVWLAARRWLYAQDDKQVDAAHYQHKKADFDARVWRALWRPYWVAKRRIPDWLPLHPSQRAFRDL
jgi:hypothetical protein